jgi:predicted ArsR family transcriptional regulator
MTVNELVEELGLTDNAVRAQLTALEQDGLVKQSGVRPGFRKPHFAYALTVAGERLFPKAYDLLLNELVAVLKRSLSPEVMATVLREVGRSLAARQTQGGGNSRRGGVERRARDAVQVLEALGGTAALERVDDKLVISGGSCPLAASVSEHPEVCQIAEALVAEIVGSPVREFCDRAGPPRCRFEIA